MNRKIICVVIAFFMVFCVSCNSEHNFSKVTKEIQKTINDFESYRKDYTQKEIDTSNLIQSAEGSRATGYYNNLGILKFIEGNIYGEMGRKIYEIYIINESTIYLTITDLKYSKPIYESDYGIKEKGITKYVQIKGNLMFYNEKNDSLDSIKDESFIAEDLHTFLECQK